METFKKMKSEILETSGKLQLDKQKRFGIPVQRFWPLKDSALSFNLGCCANNENRTIEDDHIPRDDIDEEESFLTMIIIPRNSKALLVWNAIHIIACLASSYMYAYLAAFSEKGDSTFFEIIMVLEIIFFISFCLNFITDYKEEGVA